MPNYVLDEQSVQKLHRMVQQNQLEIANLRRSLAHFAVRGHRDTWMPGGEGSDSQMWQSGSTSTAGKNQSTDIVSQDTGGSSLALDETNKLDFGGTNIQPFNPSELPLPASRVYPVVTDPNGSKFPLPLWSCFGIQCMAVYQLAADVTTSSNYVDFPSWMGPHAADTYDNTLWYNLTTDGLSQAVQLKNRGDYLVFVQAQFANSAGTAAWNGAQLELNDEGGTAIVQRNSSWIRDASSPTYSALSLFAVHTNDVGDSSSDVLRVKIIKAGTGVVCTAVHLFIMPCGFGETK